MFAILSADNVALWSLYAPSMDVCSWEYFIVEKNGMCRLPRSESLVCKGGQYSGMINDTLLLHVSSTRVGVVYSTSY